MSAEREPEAEVAERGVMSIGDHLDELRKRLLLALAVPVPLAFVAFFFAPSIRWFLCEPAFRAQRASGMPAQLQVLNPVETLATDMHLALVVALVVSAPWILWQLWKFIEPGLYASEKRFVRFLVPWSAGLTIAGISLLQWVLMPLMLRFLVSFGGPAPTQLISAPESAAPGTTVGEATGEAGGETAPAIIPMLVSPPANPRPGQVWITPDHHFQVALPTGDGRTVELFAAPLRRLGPLDQQYRLREYLEFVLTLMLGTAVAFQLPLVILLLGWAGVIEGQTLRRYRRHAIFVCAIMAAIITPTGDPVSMVVMAFPLYGLFELGLLLLVIAPPRAVAEGSVIRRLRNLALGRSQVLL